MKLKKRNIFEVIKASLVEANMPVTKSSVTYFYLKTLQETVKRLDTKKASLLTEGADLDPEKVQSALEDAAGQLSVLQDFLNPDNMKRFEAAAEFIPQLDDFFGSLNTHFEIQKQKEEEAAAEAEEAAAQAEADAEAEAEKAAEEAEEEAAEAEEEQAEEEPPPAEQAEEEPEPEPEEPADPEPPEEEPQAEEPEEPAEALEEGLLRRWKALANIRG